jgi:YidC/Oxa1 family membrane protein insertase
MDRNSIIGLLLMFAILVGYAYLNQPSPEQLAEQKRYSDSMRVVNAALELAEKEAEIRERNAAAEQQNTPQDTQNLVETFGKVGTRFFGDEELITLKSPKLEITFSNKGGRIIKTRLPEFKRADTINNDLILFDEEHLEDYLVFFTEKKAFKTHEVFWELKKQTANSITYILPFDDKAYIESTYTLDSNAYGVDFSLQLVHMESYVSNNYPMSYFRKLEAPKQELKAETEREKSTIYFKYSNEKPDYIGETKYKTEILKAPVEWVSFKQQFFNTTIIYPKGFLKDSEIITEMPGNEVDHVKTFTAQLDLPYESRPIETYDMRFYFGPNHYNSLKKENIDLEGIIPLGWTVFRWVNQFLVIPTFHYLNKFTDNYGLIILILTIFIKILLFPLVYKSYLSTAKMKLLKPELDQIKEKANNDLSKTQMETMKLYKKAGVSPIGGCLPLMLQFPILIAMFSFFPASFELRQKSFLWAEDLSRYDSILDLGFNIPFYGDHVSLFTLLMTISTIIYTRMNNQLSAAGPQMKIISYMMPIMFLGFFNNYPAALSYYYFLANMITFLQQFIMKNFVDEEKLRQKINENKKKPVTLKKSGLQKRLEEFAKKRGIDPNTGKLKK